MSAPENPAAFPVPYDSPGMTLRDWFAGHLAAAELASAGANRDAAEALAEAADRNGQTIPERIAFNAYEVADAMLAARVVAEPGPAPAPQPGPIQVPPAPDACRYCNSGLPERQCECVPF